MFNFRIVPDTEKKQPNPNLVIKFGFKNGMFKKNQPLKMFESKT